MNAEHKKDTKDCFMTLRIPAEIYNSLRKSAEDNTRTFSSQVLHYIKQGLANEK
jgi:hypothetical protein